MKIPWLNRELLAVAPAPSLNGATVAIKRPHLGPPRFAKLFVRHYARLRAELDATATPTLIVLAIDRHSGELHNLCRLAAPVGAPGVAIIGRHREVDLRLIGDDEVSLRHLALLTRPLSAEMIARRELGFRLIDLNTAAGFGDERGNRLESVSAESPIFVSCGRYALCIVPAGLGEPWPDDGEDAWASIPERVYLEESAAEPDRAMRERFAEGSRTHGPAVMSRTLVTTRQGPRSVERDLCADGEVAIGRLGLEAGAHREQLTVGDQAVHDGLLVGRLARCHSGPMGDRSLSRVHLLVIRIGDRVYAIDVGSTYGTWSTAGERCRLVELAEGSRLGLGKRDTRLCWTAAAAR